MSIYWICSFLFAHGPHFVLFIQAQPYGSAAFMHGSATSRRLLGLGIITNFSSFLPTKGLLGSGGNFFKMPKVHGQEEKLSIRRRNQSRLSHPDT